MGKTQGWQRVARWREAAKAALMSAALTMMAGPPAFAELPVDWQLGMQAPASPVRDHIDVLHDEVMVIITLIVLLVMGLIIYVMIRFNAKRHPVASKVSHNALIEVIWTVVPVLILVIIAVPSFKLLYYEGEVVHPTMTLNVTGHQWYWTYEYPDQDKLTFDSNILPEDQAAKEGKPRLLAVDNPVVVPVGTVIRILVTSTDVIHSWFVSAVGVQEYAVAGRENEAWMEIERPGTYYGQCNQICGLNHPFMPIEIEAVSKGDFAKWLEQAKKKFASDDRAPAGAAELHLAAASGR